jgi:predicted homoserine dehydrogenase-like protein
MNLHTMLLKRQAEGRPVRVGVIGAGKFGSMYLAQALHTAGIHILAVGDLSAERAKAALKRTGWPEERYAAKSFGDALKSGRTFVTTDVAGLIAADGIEVVVEATGHPPAAIKHALAAFAAKRHVVMVTVEGDALAGPVLAEKAQQAGVVYTMAYGDQPALICEMVDWGRACGFEIVCAGEGREWRPPFRYSTPETVWKYFGWDAETVAKGDFNPQMYNSFVDGTKGAIEMAAVANATRLGVQQAGLEFPPAGVHDLAEVLKPRADGGQLEFSGCVESTASLERDGRAVFNHIRWGVFVTFRAPDEYTRQCLKQYGLNVDKSGWYGALWRPFHLIGLETGISVACAALRGEATGAPVAWIGDAVATAKRDLRPGDVLDGEGGYMVWGRLMPAAESARIGALPIGLAHGFKVKNTVPRDQPLRWTDVEVDESIDAVRVRRDMERRFAPQARKAAE